MTLPRNSDTLSDRSSLLHHSGGELAEALADQCLGVFGSITPTNEQHERLADDLLGFAAEWIVAEFNLPIPVKRDE